MKYKLIISISILILVLSAGCIFEKEKMPEEKMTKKITVKYLDSRPIITKEDFPDFDLLGRAYYIAQENMSTSLEIEGIHRETLINASDEMPEGYRIYGVTEAYNTISENRYMLLQYKVFDSKKKLNDSMNMTVLDYSKEGFRYKTLDNNSYDERIFILESDNITNISGVNVTIILFGYDTVIGKIGVQDSKERSFDEAIKMLDIILDRLTINTKDVVPAKMDFGMN